MLSKWWWRLFSIHLYCLLDGTFQTVKCLPPFKQILFVQAKIGDTQLLPVAFTLLTQKVDNLLLFFQCCISWYTSVSVPKRQRFASPDWYWCVLCWFLSLFRLGGLFTYLSCLLCSEFSNFILYGSLGFLRPGYSILYFYSG